LSFYETHRPCLMDIAKAQPILQRFVSFSAVRKGQPIRAGPFKVLVSPPLPYENAAFTLSGENGTRRNRTPVASKIALAIAAATGRLDGSPAPEGGMSG
jgi:hypothetical protein